MLDSLLQKKKPTEKIKCIKCRTREATKEDQMCDSCRFLITLENIIENRK